ncbi:MAG: hypothetical protein FWF15_05120 [Oscillospiraceae bacterium]|nr:hypothetical protein [Oscillospiraceae bacterium]
MDKELTFENFPDGYINDDALILWKYNGHEYEFDMQDLETFQKLDEAKKVFVEIDVEKSDIEKITLTYEMFLKFFDVIFGRGKEIVGVKINVRNAVKAYHSFMSFINDQNLSTVNYFNSINKASDKYNVNRAARRANK